MQDNSDDIVRERFLDHIRVNLERVGTLLETDPVEVRSLAAEQGYEFTPDECCFLLQMLREGYQIVVDDQSWS